MLTSILNSIAYYLPSRILLIILSLLPGAANATLNVFTCEPEWAALVQELGGDRVEVFSATTAMQDPHHIQARPGLIAKARQADLLVCSGAELELGWLPLLLRKAGNSTIMSANGQFFAADHVDMIEVPTVLDRSQGDVHADGNPHVHTSPENILTIAGALADRLALVDPGQAHYYRQSLQRFSHGWREAMARWKEQAGMLESVKIISHHRYWSYFNSWAGLELIATLEAIPGVSPGSSHLATVSKLADQEQVSMIVHVAYVNDRPAQWLAERTGLPVVALPASVDFQSGQSLQQWFDLILDKLIAAIDGLPRE